MKTKLLLLVTILFATFIASARTPRVSNKSFTYQTIKLPQMALPEVRTYSVSLETAADYGNLALRFQNVLQIPGWVKANNASYNVDLQLFPVDYARPQLVTRKQVIKDDSTGKVIKTNFFYRYVYKAVGSASLQIFNEADQAIYSNGLQQVCLQRTGREYRSRKEARRRSHREGTRFQQQMAVDFAQAFTGQANRQLDGLLGIYPIQKRETLMIVRNKKHSEYKLMQNFWTRFRNIADLVDANSNLQKIEARLFNEIAYLKNIENKYRGSKKADRKMRYIAYRNLTTIYEMLEMPQEAIYYAQKIRGNDFRKFNAAFVIADAQRMKRLQELHGF